MVVHWLRATRAATSERDRRAHTIHLGINAVGASTTAVALGVILIAKLAANLLAMIQLASMRLWLRAYESTA